MHKFNQIQFIFGHLQHLLPPFALFDPFKFSPLSPYPLSLLFGLF